jgi:serine/threonine-protein kinase HipA
MGEHKVGTIAESPNREIYFEYSPEWLLDGFSISPYFLPLAPGLKREETLIFEGLFGAFDDSIPDGWGLLLMDRFFRTKGMSPESLSPLDRLSYIGDSGIGALSYVPSIEGVVEPIDTLDLGVVAAQAERIAAGSPEEILPVLRAAGGSSGGSRPKVFIAFNPSSGLVSTETSAHGDGFEQWLVKFRATVDPVDAGAIEAAYAEMARAAGLDVPPTRLFETSAGRFFGTKRFDRGPGSTRIHTHTFGGLVHSDFRHPNRDYEEFLSVTFDLTKDFAQVEQAFLRAAFNVMAHNRDDHVRNHAFIVKPDGRWGLSPAYDITHSDGVNGEHNMTVSGKGRPGTKDLLKLAVSAGIPHKGAIESMAMVSASLGRWSEFAEKAGVSEESRRRIMSSFRSEV